MSEKNSETFTVPVTGKYKVGSAKGIELIETKGNCVLEDFELKMIDGLFNTSVHKRTIPKNRKLAKQAFDKLFQKITKLNEMVKEKINGY